MKTNGIEQNGVSIMIDGNGPPPAKQSKEERMEHLHSLLTFHFNEAVNLAETASPEAKERIHAKVVVMECLFWGIIKEVENDRLQQHLPR